MSLTDQTIAADKWVFDEAVTAVFENMLSRSIPQYDTMRELSSALAVQFAQDGTWIIDLGCSRGDGLKHVLSELGARNRYLGIEISQPMIAAAREALAGYIQAGLVELRELDLREKYPPMKASVVQSIFTLQFVPLEYRQQVVQNVYDHLLPGGAFIFVEKILGNGSQMQTLMVKHYLDMKRAHGYTFEQIESKRKSLEGVLVPLTATQNEQMLQASGFTVVDCYWRWMNFCGWLAVKK